jgi:hypothetical protein
VQPCATGQRVLKLIRAYLESGVMINGVVMETEEGTPQVDHCRRCCPISCWSIWIRNWKSRGTNSCAMRMTAISMSRRGERVSA